MNDYVNADQVRKPLTYTQLLKKLWPYFMNHRWEFIAVVVSMLLLTVAGRLLPSLFGYAIDHGILAHDRGVVVHIAVISILLEISRSFLVFLHSYLFVRMGNQILFEIRSRLIAHVQRLPIPYFDKTPTGRVVTRLTNDVLSMGELFTEGLIMVITNALSLISIVIALFLISPRLTMISLLIIPVMLWISFYLSNRVQEILRQSKQKLAAINAFVAESLNGIKILQLHNSTHKRVRQFSVVSHEYFHLQLKSVRLSAYLWPIVSFFFAASLATALYAGGTLRHEGSLAIGSLIAFLMNIQDFFPPVRSILEKYQQFQNSLTGAERVFTLLDEAEETGLDGREPLARLQGRVEFDRVRFRYGADLPWVLRDLSFTIEPGRSLAIVGRTGSGKSTTIALLQQFHGGYQGAIRIDGKNLTSFAKRDLRTHIGVVQQDNFIFRGTIAENISLFNPKISRAQLERAIQLSSCSEVVARHGGLDGFIEERGGNLSVGELQLIAFARVLAYDPDILILDEATANIDSQSELLIQRATREVTRGRTSIIIAHRLSTILECDLILVLDGGELRELGSHTELMAKRAMYYDLYQSQFREKSSPTDTSQSEKIIT